MRVFIYSSPYTKKALAAFDAKVTNREIKPEGKPNLASVTAGMIVRPAGDNGRPDMATAYEIEAVTASVIKLKTEKSGKGGTANLAVPDPSSREPEAF